MRREAARSIAVPRLTAAALAIVLVATPLAVPGPSGLIRLNAAVADGGPGGGDHGGSGGGDGSGGGGGSGGGDKGGRVVAEGTPEDVSRVTASVTGRFLAERHSGHPRSVSGRPSAESKTER